MLGTGWTLNNCFFHKGTNENTSDVLKLTSKQIKLIELHSLYNLLQTVTLSLCIRYWAQNDTNIINKIQKLSSLHTSNIWWKMSQTPVSTFTQSEGKCVQNGIDWLWACIFSTHFDSIYTLVFKHIDDEESVHNIPFQTQYCFSVIFYIVDVVVVEQSAICSIVLLVIVACVLQTFS